MSREQRGLQDALHLIAEESKRPGGAFIIVNAKNEKEEGNR